MQIYGGFYAIKKSFLLVVCLITFSTQAANLININEADGDRENLPDHEDLINEADSDRRTLPDHTNLINEADGDRQNLPDHEDLTNVEDDTENRRQIPTPWEIFLEFIISYCKNLDYSSQNISNKNFDHQDLSFVNFKNAQLSEVIRYIRGKRVDPFISTVNLRQANISGADFRDAYMVKMDSKNKFTVNHATLKRLGATWSKKNPPLVSDSY